MKKQTVVLFGGSFDPIHKGHTTVATCAIDQLHADQVFFVPAKRSPLKKHMPQANDQQRLDMIQLAIQDCEGYQVCDYEVNRPAPSYTLHTVKHFKETYGDNSTLYWLIGADAVRDLPQWYGIKELLDLCTLSTMHRAGCAEPSFASLEPEMGPKRVSRLSQHIITTPLMPISSTDIRKRLKHNESTTDLLDPQVEKYIKTNHLYEGGGD
ncbi:MAG: nicotinate (nicotinamide) nucleotide adenylyltransferase [Phycisphaeraceae bacterium]|nr:nicotinate (nicotinamide) nucleotide adenylyltransferase [Phycisphaeraceae bacterium]